MVSMVRIERILLINLPSFVYLRSLSAVLSNDLRRMNMLCAPDCDKLKVRDIIRMHDLRNVLHTIYSMYTSS